MRSSPSQARSRSSGVLSRWDKLERDNVANRLGISLILERLELPPVTEAQIDEVLDER